MESWRDEQWRVAAKEDAPDYTTETPTPGRNCGNCRFLNDGGCRLFQFKPAKNAWCSSWKDGKFYGWWGGGRFPSHGVPPEELEDLELVNDGEGQESMQTKTLPTGDNNPSSGSNVPGSRSR